jgi:hypothetical protein
MFDLEKEPDGPGQRRVGTAFPLLLGGSEQCSVEDFSVVVKKK